MDTSSQDVYIFDVFIYLFFVAHPIVIAILSLHNY